LILIFPGGSLLGALVYCFVSVHMGIGRMLGWRTDRVAEAFP